jgi:hypothetical protein
MPDVHRRNPVYKYQQCYHPRECDHAQDLATYVLAIKGRCHHWGNEYERNSGGGEEDGGIQELETFPPRHENAER